MFLLLKHRQVLLEIFSKNYRVRRNMIQSRLTQECGEDLSKQALDKVLKVRAFRVQQPEVPALPTSFTARGPCRLLPSEPEADPLLPFPLLSSPQVGLQQSTAVVWMCVHKDKRDRVWAPPQELGLGSLSSSVAGPRVLPPL